MSGHFERWDGIGGADVYTKGVRMRRSTTEAVTREDALRSSGGRSRQSLRALLGVRELVYDGTFVPGERLGEVQVAQRLRLSRTPVRAALAQLAAEGLLEPISTGGYAVREFHFADIVDSLELRGVVEGTAARLTAERGASRATVEDLRATLAAIDEALADRQPNFTEYVRQNERFHAKLAAACPSQVIQNELARIMNLPFASPNALVAGQELLPDSWRVLTIAQSQHRALVDAIEARQGSRAEALCREHAKVALQNLEALVRVEGSRERVPNLALVRPVVA
jgi:GntR family transcriptional regulator of vanillate catabolism